MKRGQPLRRLTPLRTTTPLRSHSSLPVREPLERSGAINPVSAKRRREQAVYTKLRKAFLDEHERCEFPAGCVWPAVDVHHRRGRVGPDFLDITHWSALCRSHHDWCGLHPTAAVEMGISELRIGAA